MLSISSARSAGGAAEYFSSHLTEKDSAKPDEDYYSSEGDAGHWHGQGAAALGLRGEVQKEDFISISLGLDKDHNKLVQGAGKTDRRSGWDAVFSAPKSVSVVWAIGDETMRDAIQNAHKQAVSTALNYLESDGGIASRRGKGGLELEKSGAVIATFDHATSREKDPQLHTHCLVMNVAKRNDGTFGTLQSRELFVRKMSAGALYRAELAAQIQKIGFDVERDKKAFRITEMPKAIEREFSKRRAQIVEEMNKHGGKSAQSAEAAALATRQDKTSSDKSELLQNWSERASEHNVTSDYIYSISASNEPTPEPMRSVDEIWSELTENASTISEHQLSAKIFEESQGKLDSDSAQQYLDEFLQNDETVRLIDERGSARFTSREMLALEQHLVDFAQDQSQKIGHGIADSALEKALQKFPTLSDEQRQMVQHITSPGGMKCVQGGAGTGKSFAAAAAHEAWQNDGKKVIGAALSGKAAEGLEEGSGIKSSTIHSLLIRLEKGQQHIDNNTIIVIDEAGMVGSRLMDKLFNHAEKSGSKVVLIGDTRQLQPVDAGGAFRSIKNTLGAAELNDIRRQKEG